MVRAVVTRNGLARTALKRFAALADRANTPTPGLVILAYHRVGGGSGLDIDLSPDLFDRQMAYLAEQCSVVSLDAAMDSPGEVGSDTRVAVTFDDGTADFVDHALPAMERHGIHATYYIASRFIEEQASFPDAGTPMSWAALTEATSTGLVAVGSHTHSHAVMDKLSPSEADDEMRRSTELIEDRLGSRARHFAYPKGVFGGVDNERVVARYCDSAALARCGTNPYGKTDKMRLLRSPIQQSDGFEFFRNKAAGGMAVEGWLREGVNSARYRSKSN